MLIYLLRHGETDWNKEQRLQGREDVPLNAAGIQQAHNATVMFDGIHLDKILTSPLSRASVTAQIIADYTNTPVFIEPDLIERDFGSLSGTIPTSGDIFRLTDETSDVEPVEQVSERIMNVIKKYPLDSSILLVSHGGAINSVLVLAAGKVVDPGRTRLKNTCLSCLDYDGENFKVLFYNKTAE